MKLLPKDRGNGVSNAVSKWGLGPRIIFWRLKIHSARFCMQVLVPSANNGSRERCRRLANADALKRHERVNAFNLVD